MKNSHYDPFVGYVGPLSPASSPPPTPTSANTTSRADHISNADVVPASQIIHRVTTPAGQNFSVTRSSSSSVSRHNRDQYTALVNQLRNERAFSENELGDDGRQYFLGGNTAGTSKKFSIYLGKLRTLDLS